MPLPANNSLSLQGQLRPGMKPKLAMVVRMTEEALDTLQQLDASEQMEFEFGERPGIHIRTAFFPLNITTVPQESELYVRTTTHARPTAPLKLSAALAGTIRVGRTSTTIPDKVVKRINETSAELNDKRREVKVVGLPVKEKVAPGIKTVKKTVTSRNTSVVTSGHTRNPSNNTATIPNGSSSVPTISLTKEEETALQNKLIHFLALGPQPLSAISKEAGGNEASTNIVLRQIAEPEPLPKNSTVQQQDQPWRLKPRSWQYVRPYTYQKYSEADAVVVSRSARQWFKNLKVPESDPLWEHVRFRSGNTSNTKVNGAPAPTPTASTSNNRRAPKRDSEIQMKSEVGMSSAASSSLPAHAARSGRGNTPPEPTPEKARLRAPEADGEREEGELSASSTPPPHASSPANAPNGRKPPGSKTLLQQQNKHVFLPNRPMTPPVGGNGTMNAQAGPSQPGPSAGVKRSNGPIDARSNRRPPPPEPSERARPLPPIAPPIPVPDKKAGTMRKDALMTSSQQKAAATAAKEANRERQREKDERRDERERDRLKRERERDSKQQEREQAKEKEREKEKAAQAQLNKKLAASAQLLVSSSNTVSKKRAREVSPGPSDHGSDSSDFDMEEIRREKRRRKEAKMRESGAGLSMNGKSESALKNSKLDRAYDRDRDLSISRRAASPLPRKVKREERASIPPASQEYLSSSQVRSSSALASSSKAVSSSKLSRSSEKGRSSSTTKRRPSPKFTSDEEEGEEERPLKVSSSSRRGKVKNSDVESERSVSTSLKASYLHPSSAGSARPSPSPRPSHALPHKPPPPASAPIVSSKVEQRSRSPMPRREREREREREHSRMRSRSPSPARRRPANHNDDMMDVDTDPLPPRSENERLRERYATTYAAYIDAFNKVVNQKNKITRVLQSRNSASGSASVSESEADMMSPEEIEKLSKEHRRLHGELESIRSLYGR
ncbi:hypothetical protein SCHPADRAFT_991695 [Schizopora paradoxa]|uniref:RNA polymerase II elongation factor ELL N-terminal domain-containing protein n=1 Tax=Schizopora paradoxa TaxID=27342 RepID=A0A0H2S7R7_9AGAM|nr:hypothetical protein SCHPADRAFT_991695 [Schizopora paradoxa]